MQGVKIRRPFARLSSSITKCTRILTVVMLVLLLDIESALATQCSSFNDGIDGPYWDKVAMCGGCLDTAGCGYCLSTLECMDGDSIGPKDGSSCPSWISSKDECPVKPICHQFVSCNACANIDECAWCASEKSCMTVSDIFNTNCRGTVFDLPCPASFVGVNRVIGNLVVEEDPVFGGGHFRVTGPANGGRVCFI